MGFIVSSNNMLVEDEHETIEHEINALVKAKGFDPGNYTFEPRDGTQRPNGSIINGYVIGRFSANTKNANFAVFERDQFSEKIWRRICTSFGFKYHRHQDIYRITVLPATIDVDVVIETPNEEY